MKNPITEYLRSLFTKIDRKPAESGHIIVLSGALLIGTEDGNSVVFTPKAAREIAPLLSDLADRAEKDLPQAV